MSHWRAGQLRGHGPRYASFGASAAAIRDCALKRARLLAGIYISPGFFYFRRFLIVGVVTLDANICCRSVSRDLRRSRESTGSDLGSRQICIRRVYNI